MSITQSEESQLKALLNAIVPNKLVTWDPSMLVRYRSLQGYPVFRMFDDNVKRLVDKIPLLKAFRKKARLLPQHTPQIVPWIKAWFDRVTFSETSVIHSIPAELKDITYITHNIILLYLINNVNVVVHGSFMAYLLDPRVKYADIDLICIKDELIYITSFLVYVYLNVETHILSIPFIINHRQLRVDGDQTSLCDAVKMDLVTRDTIHGTYIQIVDNVKVNTLSSIVVFLNYFKMLHLPERSKKMRHYKDNQLLIISALTKAAMKEAKRHDHSDAFAASLQYDVTYEILPDSIILVTLRYQSQVKKFYL